MSVRPEEATVAEGFSEVVVGVDGTQACDRVLREALRMAAECQAPLRAVRAWELAPGARDDAEPRWHAALGAVIDADTRGQVGAVVAQYSHIGEVTVQCVEGPAGPVLVEVSKSARLLVIGGPLSGRVPHDARSTSWYVLTHARCPVEIVELATADAALAGPSIPEQAPPGHPTGSQARV